MEESRRREEGQRQQNENALREAAQREASREQQQRPREMAERRAAIQAAEACHRVLQDRQREQQALRQADENMRRKREAAVDFRFQEGNQQNPNPAPPKPAVAAAKPAKPAAPAPEKLTDADKTTRHAVIRALGEWKHTPAIEGLAERLATPADRVAAAKALKEMGNQSEQAMLKLLGDEDLWARVSAIDVLSKVGRQNVTQALEAASESDGEKFVRTRAKTALRDIQSRPATDAG